MGEERKEEESSFLLPGKSFLALYIPYILVTGATTKRLLVLLYHCTEGSLPEALCGSNPS